MPEFDACTVNLHLQFAELAAPLLVLGIVSEHVIGRAVIQTVANRSIARICNRFHSVMKGTISPRGIQYTKVIFHLAKSDGPNLTIWGQDLKRNCHHTKTALRLFMIFGLQQRILITSSLRQGTDPTRLNPPRQGKLEMRQESSTNNETTQAGPSRFCCAS